MRRCSPVPSRSHRPHTQWTGLGGHHLGPCLVGFGVMGAAECVELSGQSLGRVLGPDRDEGSKCTFENGHQLLMWQVHKAHSDVRGDIGPSTVGRHMTRELNPPSHTRGRLAGPSAPGKRCSRPMRR